MNGKFSFFIVIIIVAAWRRSASQRPVSGLLLCSCVRSVCIAAVSRFSYDPALRRVRCNVQVGAVCCPDTKGRHSSVENYRTRLFRFFCCYRSFFGKEKVPLSFLLVGFEGVAESLVVLRMGRRCIIYIAYLVHVT